MQNLHQIVELREALDDGPASPSKKPHVAESPQSNNSAIYGLKRVAPNTTHTTVSTSRGDSTPCYGIQRVTSQSNARPSGSPPLPPRLPLDLDKLKSDSTAFQKTSPPKTKMFDIGWNRSKARARAGLPADKCKPDAGCCSPDTKGPWADHRIDGSDLKMDWEAKEPKITHKGSNRLKRSKGSKGAVVHVEEKFDGKDEATKDGKTPECDRKMTFDKIVPDGKIGEMTDDENEKTVPKSTLSGTVGELFKKAGKGLGKVKGMLTKRKESKAE